MLYTDHTYKTIGTAAADKIILLPLGATEQHGPHLAVSTDTDIVSSLALAAEQALPQSILLCPPLAIGSSDHHLAFGGTISVPPAFYTELVIHMVTSLLGNGFRKIVLLNGHGGNITPVKQALSVLSHRFDETLQPNIALATYWELAGKAFAGAPPMESPALSHACEYETSLMLHLFPGKVWMDKAVRAERPASNGYIPWEDDEPYRGVSMVKQTGFVSGNGSSGLPALATAAKGKYLFDQSLAALIEWLKAFGNWPKLQNISTR